MLRCINKKRTLHKFLQPCTRKIESKIPRFYIPCRARTLQGNVEDIRVTDVNDVTIKTYQLTSIQTVELCNLLLFLKSLKNCTQWSTLRIHKMSYNTRGMATECPASRYPRCGDHDHSAQSVTTKKKNHPCGYYNFDYLLN